MAALLFVFVVPAALAGQGSGEHGPRNCPTRNPNCITRTTTITITGKSTITTYPPSGTTTITTTSTSISTGTVFAPCKDGTPPPCKVELASAESKAGRGIPAGVVFLGLGLASVVYLWIQRRWKMRQLKADE